MEVDLLIEIQVFFRALTLARETRVIDAAAIRVPGRAAAGGGVLDVRDGVAEFLPVGRIVKVEGAIFAPAFGKINLRDLLSIERRLEPIDRGRAFAVELVGIDQHLLRF